MNRSACAICLQPCEDAHHRKCLTTLFGTTRVPAVDLGQAKLQAVALAMVGRTTLSGVQKKISVGLTGDRATLRMDLEGSGYILKPQTETFPRLPELEWVTMRLAERAGVPVPPCGLLELQDGSTAYLVRRFDRREDGSKVRVEDFCQLGGLPPKDKYAGSAELCVRLVRRFASEPLIELSRLLRQLVVAWWVGNGDLHLKNLSMLIDPEGLVRLTPAYDMVSTRMVLPEDPLALPVTGKQDNLKADTWMQLAEYAHIPPRAARRILGDVVGSLPAALDLIQRSPLPEPTRESLSRLVTQRSAILAQATTPGTPAS